MTCYNPVSLTARAKPKAMDRSPLLLNAIDRLNAALSKLRFSPPVTHVYNPLVYARAGHEAYVKRYARTPKQVLFLGMNPGPFGMAQTGVPFGEIALVRDFLGIEVAIDKPKNEHPKRPVLGFACPRSEVSGARLWGLWRSLFGSGEAFSRWAFVANYCPLVFMEASGRNLTPDKLKRAEQAALLAPCDEHLRSVVEALSPSWVIGVGAFAKARAAKALVGVSTSRGTPRLAVIPHPSPASPAANRNWAGLALQALYKQGVPLPDAVRPEADGLAQPPA